MNFVIKFLALAIGVFLAVGLFTASYLNKIEVVKRMSEIKINNQTVVAEVVNDAEEREQGLAGKNEIGVNEGMLFLFDEPGVYGFWMKGMNFPIDIIWIAGDEIVGIEKNVEPELGARDEELKVYYPTEPVNKVLELKAGRAELLRAEVGDEVKIRPLVNTSK
ncbi:MAG: DUF192 domain-containing protein [Candidatus Jorgensenbacteria bacterium]